jgi:3-oxoacyl-[acyl-carrier-protein] synthase I
MTPVYLHDLGIACALGSDRREVLSRLLAGDGSGLQPLAGFVPGRRPLSGRVTAVLPSITPELSALDSRNNRLLLSALADIEASVRALIARYGRARIGIALGTSTSGIAEGEAAAAHALAHGGAPAHFDYRQQELASPAEFLSRHLGLSGPAMVVSTACTSSAKALLSAERWLRLGVCDAVIAGGVDTLCRMTLNGFAALEAVSETRCNPFSVNRAGINIGEAAALFVVSREPAPIALLGGAANGDAHHMSAPEPSGRGASDVMREALHRAGLAPQAIAYLNLHGTATRQNDAMESHAVRAVFGQGPPCSATKALSGHALGAAGALEAAFCWLCLSDLNTDERLPPQLWDGQPDPDLPALDLVAPGRRFARVAGAAMMSNSFAFGGSNAALILGLNR